MVEQGDARIEAAAEAALAHRRGRGRPREDPLRGQGEEVGLARKAATAPYGTRIHTRGHVGFASLRTVPLGLASRVSYRRLDRKTHLRSYSVRPLFRWVA